MISQLLGTPLAMSKGHVRGLIWLARQLPDDVVAELPLTVPDRIALAAIRRSAPIITRARSVFASAGEGR